MKCLRRFVLCILLFTAKHLSIVWLRSVTTITIGFRRRSSLRSEPDDSIGHQKEEFEPANAPSETEEKEEEEEKEEIENKAEEKESETTVVMKCKKTDGKRWRCNRAAKLPHSLCSYHLAQLRTYRARFDHQIFGNRRKNSSLAADSAGTTSNHYYYYSILGPWWGKRRGPINGDEGSRSFASNDDALDSNEESESSARDGDGQNGHEDAGEVKCDTKKKKKKRVIKRRGRKP